MSNPESLHAPVELLGYVAATLTTVSFFPQVVRTWRFGGHELSWAMLSLFGAGVSLWLAYGILAGSAPIVAANGLTVAQVAVIAALKANLLRRK